MQYGGKKTEAKFEVNATISLGKNVFNPNPGCFSEYNVILTWLGSCGV